MTLEEQDEINQDAYRRLRLDIDRDYPKGHCVAIWGGKIVADAPTFRELHDLLNSMGLTSPHVFVAQSGAEYYEYVDIL